MTSRRTARGNRLGLALVGLALLVAGGYALSRGTGRLLGVPASDPLIPASLRDLARSQPWFWPAVAVAAGAIALLALRWLLVQLRTGHLRRLVLDEDEHSTVTLDTRALASVTADDIASLPGTRRARVAFADGVAPFLVTATVVADEHADLAQVRSHVLRSLRRIRDILEADSLPALIRLRLRGSRRSRRRVD